MEVVQHPIIPVKELSRSSSGVDDLLLEVSEVLGMSLSEVRDWYFWGSDKVERDHIMAEEWDHYRECQRFKEGQKRVDVQKHHQELQSYYEDTTF
jgi:hypothetical protein